MDHVTWAIVIFPAFQPSERRAIDRIRAAYDPLATMIAPHITLVFPFEATLFEAALHDAAGLADAFRTAVREITAYRIAPDGARGAQHSIQLPGASGQKDS